MLHPLVFVSELWTILRRWQPRHCEAAEEPADYSFDDPSCTNKELTGLGSSLVAQYCRWPEKLMRGEFHSRHSVTQYAEVNQHYAGRVIQFAFLARHCGGHSRGATARGFDGSEVPGGGSGCMNANAETSRSRRRFCRRTTDLLIEVRPLARCKLSEISSPNCQFRVKLF